MASVKRFPGSDYWYACYKLPTGQVDGKGRPIFKRCQTSTKQTDRGAALQIAIAYEKSATLVAEKRWNEQSAHRFLNELSVISGVSVTQVQQVDAFFKKWLDSKEKSIAPKSHKNFKSIVAQFGEFLGARRLGPLVDVTPAVVADFRDAELAKGKSGNTVNKALSILGQAFDEAVNQLALERNPTKGLRVKRAAAKAQEREPFTFDQFRELVRRTGPKEKSKRGRTVHPDWQTFIIATGYTGGRQQEVARVEWDRVNLDLGLISLRRSKSGDHHWMPMHPSLGRHLAARKARLRVKNPLGFVLPALAGLPERRLSKVFRETILPRVGISQPYAKRTAEKGVGRVLAKYAIHSLRHSLSTWLHEYEVPDLVRMRIVGHDDEEVSHRYTHTELKRLAKEMRKIPAL